MVKGEGKIISVCSIPAFDTYVKKVMAERCSRLKYHFIMPISRKCWEMRINVKISLILMEPLGPDPSSDENTLTFLKQFYTILIM